MATDTNDKELNDSQPSKVEVPVSGTCTSHKTIEALVDDAVRPLRERHYDSYKAYTTIIFTALVLLVGVMGVLSRIEVRDQVMDMQTRFERQEGELRNRFEMLAGEALKRANIELLHEGKPLEGQAIEIRYLPNNRPNDAILDTLFIRNSGDKRTEPIAMRVSIGAPDDLDLDPYNKNPRWERTSSPDKNYAVSFYSSQQVMVHPGETFGIYPLHLDWRLETSLTNRACKLEVFYGDARPAEAVFNAVFVPR